MKRYEIRWASLDPTVGSEMAKERPVVIVSRDELNDRLSTVTICPLTSQLHPTWRTRMQVRVARKLSEIAVDHIRSISKDRIGKKLGALSTKDAATLRRLILDMYASEGSPQDTAARLRETYGVKSAHKTRKKLSKAVFDEMRDDPVKPKR